MRSNFEDKVVLVTGASQGIGLAIAEEFADNGADVIVAAHDNQALDKAVESIRKGGGRAQKATLDMADIGQVRDLAESLNRDAGRINVLVNNVGIGVAKNMRQTTA